LCNWRVDRLSSGSQALGEQGFHDVLSSIVRSVLGAMMSEKLDTGK
jgi:hypothetical protein